MDSHWESDPAGTCRISFGVRWESLEALSGGVEKSDLVLRKICPAAGVRKNYREQGQEDRLRSYCGCKCWRMEAGPLEWRRW